MRFKTLWKIARDYKLALLEETLGLMLRGSGAVV